MAKSRILAQSCEKEGAGRPRVEIPLGELEKLASFGCTIEEAAGFFGVSLRTMNRRIEEEVDFARAWEKGKASMKCSLRRKQVQIAMEGNPTMLIWLGKMLLGQHDRVEVEHAGALAVTDVRDTLRSRIASLATRVGTGEGDSGTVQ